MNRSGEKENSGLVSQLHAHTRAINFLRKYTLRSSRHMDEVRVLPYSWVSCWLPFVVVCDGATFERYP